MPDAKERLAVALDLDGRSAILATARRLAPAAGVLKLGLQAFVSEGPELVREVAALGSRIFLDLKLHDIPATVGKAAAAAVRTGAWMVNAHACGGSEMLRVFAGEGRAAAAKAGLPPPKLIAVTILTSLDAASLAAIGISGSPRDAAVRLAVLAKESGLDGVVSSPEEIEAIRSACGPGFFLVVPGIRPRGTDSGDQKRVATPGEAIRRGADLLVVGRPILEARDPVEAAGRIAREMDQAFRELG
jgi:orotidine-5'-phosphate decarboxylase